MFGPLIIKSAKSKADKTGSWRIKSKPQFLQKNCIACRMCLLVCPEGCIQGKEKNTYMANYDYCKGCSLCAQVCPKADIVMIEEEGEEKK
ncbi:MAG: 4Fe-4S binding protein [Candidatus Omnitrophica bacterium]|nr:4Fe-4S binding protein [Candidatus Omnitrophota bacterium]